MNDNNIRFEDLTGQDNGSSATPPMAPKNNSFNITSMVLGIVSIVASCCINEYVGIVCGVLAIVFYVLTKRNGTANGMATAGLVCGIVGLVLGIVSIVSAAIMVSVIANNPELASLLEDFTNMQI